MITVGSVWPRPISAMNDTPITSLSRPPHPHSHPPHPPKYAHASLFFHRSTTETASRLCPTRTN